MAFYMNNECLTTGSGLEEEEEYILLEEQNRLLLLLLLCLQNDCAGYSIYYVGPP